MPEFIVKSLYSSKKGRWWFLDPLCWLYIGLLLVFVIISGFYSSTETAFATLSKYKYKVKANEGNKTASLIVFLCEHFETTLITVLIGYNVFSIAISAISTLLFLKIFNGLLNDNLVSLISSLAMAVITFLFSDSLPKFIGKKAPDFVVRTNVYPMMFFVVLFFPLTAFFRLISRLFKKIFRQKKDPSITVPEFASTIEGIEESGELEQNESDIIQASLEFDDTTVKEILTPVYKMTMLDASGLSNAKLVAFLKQCPYTRIPLYFKDKNKIVGILSIRTFLSAYFKDPKVNFMALLQKPYFVTPRVKMDDLIEGFRKHRTQVAIVRSEGNVIGMVTTEDALEEIVGKIAEAKEMGDVE